MSAIRPSQVIVSYRGIASVLEDMDPSSLTEAGALPPTGGGGGAAPRRPPRDSEAGLPAPARRAPGR